MEYCTKIKELRQDRDLNQREIAEILNIKYQQYQRYENGTYPLPLEYLVTLCRFYGVSADYILGLPRGLSWPR